MRGCLAGLVTLLVKGAVMKLMPIKQAQAKLLNALADKTLREITLSTFKKDRSVALCKNGDQWTLVEQGYQDKCCELPGGPTSKRLIKEAFGREFPRSNKAYVTEVR